MFHLSFPVRNLEACIAFYRDAFGAKVEMLDTGVANLFVFGEQITLHARATSSLTDEVRREMHFGQVVEVEDWHRSHARIVELGYSPIRAVEPGHAPNGRGKLVVADPSGNLVEINSRGPRIGAT